MQPLSQEEVAALEQRLSGKAVTPLFARLADWYRQAGRLQEALEVCDKGLAHFPHYATAHMVKGRTLIAMGMKAEARRELEIVRQTFPNNPVVARLIAELPTETEKTFGAAAPKTVGARTMPKSAAEKPAAPAPTPAKPVVPGISPAAPGTIVVKPPVIPAPSPIVTTPSKPVAAPPPPAEPADETFGMPKPFTNGLPPMPAAFNVPTMPEPAPEPAGVSAPGVSDGFSFDSFFGPPPAPPEPGTAPAPAAEEPSIFGMPEAFGAPSSGDAAGSLGGLNAFSSTAPAEPGTEQQFIGDPFASFFPGGPTTPPAADQTGQFMADAGTPADTSASQGWNFENMWQNAGAPPPQAPMAEAYEDFAQRMMLSLRGTENQMALSEYLRPVRRSAVPPVPEPQYAAPAPQFSPEPPPQPSSIEEIAQRLEGAKRMTPIIDIADHSVRTAPAPREEEPAPSMGFVTPTLAEIYAKQGWYDDAIKAYRTLAKNRPTEREKFEKRIEELTALKAKGE